MVRTVRHLCLFTHLEHLFIGISYNVMSPTKLKAVHNSAKAGLLGAIIYPLSDKKSLRLAIDMFILFIAYDDPFDEDALRLDESVATEFTNTVVSALTDTENFQPVPNLPVITAYHEYVFHSKDCIEDIKKRHLF